MSGPDDTLVLSDGTHTVYCPGCNGRYVCPAEQAVCPQCHGPADSVVRGSLAETMLMKTQVDPFSATAPFLPQPDNFDGIIGDSLHVYDFQSLLGCGAMGRVYLATHRDLDRRCALKILSPRVTETEVDYVERFRQEGRAAAALVHPNVVTIHAIGTERGFHFLEMEFVPGRSLQRTLDHEGRLPPVRATVLATGIAEGLSAAHQAHIIHRDLKPDNVLITMQGVPKIGDFGLAKRILTEDRSIGNCLVGTPNFMAPELLAGEPATPASDVYALGVCYCLMLSGRYPFTGRD
ncbi:MAG: serine/threonine-protein kinase, partial [Planctomycetaceae bacterium]